MAHTTHPNDIYESLGYMVDEAMISLKNEISLYESPTLKTGKGKPKTGMEAFCEDAGISASNLRDIFNPDKSQNMSTWIFIQIVQHLDIWPKGWAYTPMKGQETQSVKMALQTPRDPIMVCLASLIGR